MLSLDSSLGIEVVNALVAELRKVEHPAQAEAVLMGALMELGRAIFTKFIASYDTSDPVERDGVVWKPASTGIGSYQTRFGEVRVDRHRHRSVRNGPTRCFAEESLGILWGTWTSDAARLSCLLLTDLTSRAAASYLKEQGGLSPSRTRLQQLPTRVHDLLDPHREEVDAALGDAFEIPENAVTVAILLDGVMIKEQTSSRAELVQAAKARGQKVGGPIASTEASVGALAYYCRDGKRLLTRRFARMPEADKHTLKAMLRAELERTLRRRPDLAVVAVSDGAPNNWSFLEGLEPDFEIVDVFHTLEHVKRRLDRTLGVNSHANQATYAKMKEVLLTVAGGHALVFKELDDIAKRKGKFKPKKTAGRGAQPDFYHRHYGRMRFVEHRLLNLPIGSGVIEGTARYMVVDRLRRTGMRWKTCGGQGVLTLRQYAANDQFNAAWKHVERLSA